MRRRRDRARLAGLVGLALLFAAGPAGCSRAYWRKNADAEVYGLIREKAKLDARWAMPRMDVVPQTTSRHFDPANPDYGPLPPDDPAAHAYMERMSDCMRIRGSDYWDEIGMSPVIENPAWIASLDPACRGADCPPNAVAQAAPVPEPDDDRWKFPGLGRLMTFVRRPEPAGRATVAVVDPEPARLAAPPADAKPLAPKPAGRTPSAIQTVAFAQDAGAAGNGAEGGEPSPLPGGGRGAEPAVPPSGLVEPDETPDAAPPALPDAREDLSGDPGDPDAAPRDEEGPDLAAANPALPPLDDLTLEGAVCLAFLHDRGLQTELEDVYLAALDLAFDRFQFDVRFLGLGGQRPGADFETTVVPGGERSATLGTRFGISRLLPSGGQWAVELANQTLWIFTDAPDESSTASTLGFSFVQPLLLGFGRKVVLEDLTQSERNLLYAIRDVARYRHTLFVATVSGGQSGGFLGLLQQVQVIANQEDNIRRLVEQLEVAEADLEGDPITVTQLQSRLLRAQNQLRDSRRSLQDNLDLFKIQLGLPPDLPTTLETSLLEPFQLIDEGLRDVEQALDDEFLAVWSRLDPADPDPAGLRESAAVLADLAARLREVGVEAVEADFERVRQALPERLARLRDAEARNSVRENLARDRDRFLQTEGDFEVAEREVEQLIVRAANAETVEDRRLVYSAAIVLEEKLERISRNFQGIQIGLRTELIELNPFEMPAEVAVGYALTNRVDLMNQRAFVTDARRKTEVAANRLQAVLNVRVEGTARTRPLGQNDNPLDFRGLNSDYRAGVEFVAPLDQVAQRNEYRATQIAYQRVRRDYMAFEDDVKFDVRASWRQLAALEDNFEVARNAIRVAAVQFDQSVERALDPARTQTGNQGLNLLQALDSVLSAQNQLIGIWVDYESARLNIYRDMGLLELDARGLWVDPFYQDGRTRTADGRDVSACIPGRPPELGGQAAESGGPSLVPPVPAPPAGVETEGESDEAAPAAPPVPPAAELESRKTNASPPAPAGRGVRQAALTALPPKPAGHARPEPPLAGRPRTDGPADPDRGTGPAGPAKRDGSAAAAGTAGSPAEPKRWRAASRPAEATP